MSTVRIASAVRVLVCTAVLALGVASCRLGPSSQEGLHNPTIPPSQARPSALVLIVDPASSGAPTRVRNVLLATTRPDEHLVLLDMASGALLESVTSPRAPAIRVPGPPAPLPHDATAFQVASHRRALADYEATVGRGQANLLRREEQLLVAWSATAAATVARAGALQPVSREADMTAALSAAMADFSSLQQAGIVLGARKVVAILSPDGAAPVLTLRQRAGLRGTTVVVAGFPGGSNDEAGWQASLLQAGASRAVILTPATSGQLPAVVTEGLDGAVAIPLTHVRFARASHQLLKSSIPALGHLLQLLTGKYRQAAVTIDGYTDNLPIPGGNLRLSHERAVAVRAWLTSRGITASRLQANGYGDTDPVAANHPGGQPRNRRVIVVIDPAVQSPAGNVSKPAGTVNTTAYLP
jgi:outer membrane protein OmpA-like peptidoglycan-associated protein